MSFEEKVGFFIIETTRPLLRVLYDAVQAFRKWEEECKFLGANVQTVKPEDSEEALRKILEK